MTAQTRDQAIDELLSRRQIEDCLLRYARGADRADAELMRSAYHDDALDCRTDSPRTPDEFIAAWLPTQGERDLTQHIVSNISIEFDEDVAHVESYLFAAIKLTAETRVNLHGARNVDRFERRDSVWKITVRLVVPEWHVVSEMVEGSPALAHRGWSSRSKDDPSYLRPFLTWPVPNSGV